MTRGSMSRFWRLLLGVLVVTAIGIQFVPVDRSHLPDQERIPAPAAVLKILEGTCFDCHSTRNRWPWYGYVAPFSWLIELHMNDARDHVNFSTWNLYDEEERNEIIEEVWDEVDLGHMPPNYYRLLHPKAALSQNDRELLEAWALKAN